ncbi:hypothetical protein [Emticicia sp. BO119]|uniref:hypothetical protein n=1 Tax=Emticicia sp. BO119 TaxID=2757768 RepID=UPI0015F070E4|nr:hypothetical protein [Emticicia sp. BO119]MBA4851446.1 hypothetical protein [Emticicia sp. BO119]
MESIEHTNSEQTLLIRYMTILFLLVSFLSILGLFLLSNIYWKDTALAETQKGSMSWKPVDSDLCHNAH